MFINYLNYLKKYKIYFILFLLIFIFFLYAKNLKLVNLNLEEELLRQKSKNSILEYNLNWQKKAVLLREVEKDKILEISKVEKRKLLELYEKEKESNIWAYTNMPNSVYKLLQP